MLSRVHYPCPTHGCKRLLDDMFRETMWEKILCVWHRMLRAAFLLTLFCAVRVHSSKWENIKLYRWDRKCSSGYDLGFAWAKMAWDILFYIVCMMRSMYCWYILHYWQIGSLMYFLQNHAYQWHRCDQYGHRRCSRLVMTLATLMLQKYWIQSDKKALYTLKLIK